MRQFDFKPGDLIEWVYKNGGQLVYSNEEIWSSIEQRYVPIGLRHIHLCTNVDDETYSWLNEKGLFRAHVDDVGGSWLYRGEVETIVPRVRR